MGQLCPHCQASRIYQSRFRLRDIFARLFLFRAVRCGGCGQRFYRPRAFPALQRQRRGMVNGGVGQEKQDREKKSSRDHKRASA